MIFKNESGRPAWLRLLSLCMALLLCVSLAPGAGAEETATGPGGQTVEEVKDIVKKGTEGETDPSTDPSTEPTEEEIPEETVDPNAVSQEEFDLAWNALFDEETKTTYKELLKLLPKDMTVYLFREVLEAVEKCTEAVALQAEHKENINVLLEKVEMDLYLEETIKSTYIETLDIFGMGYPDMDFITMLLEAMAVYPEQSIDIAVFDEALAGMKQQNQDMQNLADLLEVTESWQIINDQLAEYAEDPDEELAVMVEQAQTTADALKADMENFFALEDPEKQAELDEKIEKLEQYVEAFPTILTILSSPQEQQKREQIAQLQQQIEQMQQDMELMREEISGTAGKDVFAYIALGVAALAVIMGIIAAVCALKKKDDEDTENLQAAIRKDLEAVNAQNGILKGRIDLLCRKLDEKKEAQPADSAQLQELQRRLLKLEEELAKNTVSAVEIKKETVDEESLPPVIGKLRLNYQSVNPKNSYLYRHDDGEYALYADNTVALRDSGLHKMNELKGWRDNGLLHMFRPEIDGKVYDSYDNLPMGYYETVAVKSRATVKQNGENVYTLLGKGCIALKRR